MPNQYVTQRKFLTPQRNRSDPNRVHDRFPNLAESTENTRTPGRVAVEFPTGLSRLGMSTKCHSAIPHFWTVAPKNQCPESAK